MPADSTNDDGLNVLLDNLDAKARHDHTAGRAEDYWANRRRYPRYPFRAGCTVRFLPAGSFFVSELPGRTRNLSRSGVGLLVRRVFAVGEPIELEIQVSGRPKTFMAGMVTFCRYAGRGYHEVGVALKVAGPEPVFSKNPLVAMEVHPWLRPHPSTF